MASDQAAERGVVSLLRTVADHLLGADGDLAPGLRAAAFAHSSAAAGRPVPDVAPVPERLVGFVEKVTAEAYKIVDADVEALRRAGYSEDAILEAVLSAAVGAGVARLEIGLNALAGSR